MESGKNDNGYRYIVATQIHFYSHFQLDNSIVVLIVPIYALFFTVNVLFVSCELSGRMSTEFNDINDLVDRFDWYLFSHAMKKMLPLIMANAQEEVGITCFGRIMCNRDTFKKVNCKFQCLFFSDNEICIFVFYGAPSI